MYNYSEIKTVHLEVTEKCNANCPMCSRNINGGDTNPWIKNRELTYKDIVKIFPVNFIKQLNHIYLCGNYGDPIIAKDTLKILKYFRENNPNLLLSLNTNGSARNNEFWSELATILGKNGYVIFSIDGLEDTNHIYRVNTVWSYILNNIKIFINNGGIAHWEYLVFEHNEHEIEQAELLSKELGFQKFQLKKSSRFVTFKNSNIKPPKNDLYKNKSINKFENQNKIVPTTLEQALQVIRPEIFNKDSFKKSDYEKFLDSNTIDCKVKNEKSIYISAEGIVQPCCWIAGEMYNWYHTPKGSNVWKYINKIGIDKLSVFNYTIEDILNNKYFTEYISSSWKQPTLCDGKLLVCSKTCGTKLFEQQFK